jgi:hypothetical protein
MLLVRGGLPPCNLALQEELLLMDCYTMAKSKKYVICSYFESKLKGLKMQHEVGDLCE